MDTTSTPDNHAHRPGAEPDVMRHWHELSSGARHLVEESRALGQDVSRVLDVQGRVDRHPYGTLIAAAGIGYVLGGGLFTPLTLSLVRLGVRVATLPLVKEQLLGIAAAAVPALRGETE